MRLLLTGFAPFGGEALNPSREVVRALRDAPPEGVELGVAELPIDAHVGRAALLPLWRSGAFDAWLGLGQAGGRAQICVERVALNLFHPRAERGLPGGEGGEQRILEAGPDAYLCAVRAAALAAAICTSGAPAVVSYTAGTFLCNQVLYLMEHELRGQAERAKGVSESRTQAVFLHLPYIPEQLAGKPETTASLPLSTQLAGVRAAIAWLRDQAPGSDRG